MNKGQERVCAFWEQAAAQVDILPAQSCVICIAMGWQFGLLCSEMGLLICKGAGGIVLYECAKNCWGLVSLCSDSVS